MNTLKKLFYGISICILLVCIAILTIASKPEWSQKVSEVLYGENGIVPTASPMPEATQTPEEENGGTVVIVPQNTPLVYVTSAPGQEQVPETEAVPPQKEEDKYIPATIDIKTVCPPRAQLSAYVEPVTDAVTIPEVVSTLNGYKEITSSMAEVNAEEVKQLKEELSEGDTGALLVFEQTYYPYYHMLDDNEKELYRQIYANAFAMTEKFKPCVEIFSTNLGRVMEAVFNDHPVLFWVETAYGCKYGPDGRVVEISLQYNETSKKAEQSKQKFEEKAEEILSVARTLSSDYEKEKYVHDRLAAKVSYDSSAAMNQSAYSALVNGKTVCAGYARAFQYLMQQLGIPCYYCRGYSGENHAWNIIELYGDYYNVDLTWDDTVPGNYDYFNRTDADLAGTHIRKSLSVKLPACGGTLYRGLEKSVSPNGESSAPSEETESPYSAGLELYYDKLCDRIETLGRGRADYSDILDAQVWKELESAYLNGNASFREDYLIRSLQLVNADYCIISLSAEEITENAFEVNCSVLVQ